MTRICIFFTLLFFSLSVLSHHSVSHYYDESSLTEYKVGVEQFRFINPNPIIDVKEVKLGNNPNDNIWHLELDNLRELVALGFNKDRFKPGDELIVSVLPSPYNPTALYVKSLQHQRLGFGYIHNARRLFDLEQKTQEGK